DRGLRADEELVAVEVRAVLDEVIRIALALEGRARRVALEFEGPRADHVLHEVVRIFVQVLLGVDDVPRRREVREQRRRRVFELEYDGARVGGIDARDRRIRALSNAPSSRGWEDQLVVGGLDVNGRQGRSIVEP